VYGVERLDQLADKVGLPYGTVRNWHSRDAIPLAHLLQLEKSTGVRREWIETGQGDRYVPAGPQGDALLAPQAPLATPPKVQEARPPSPVVQGMPARGRPDEMVVALTRDTLPLVLSVSTQQGQAREYRVIPRIQGEASAGVARNGGPAVQRMVDLAGDMAFTPEWLERQIGPNTGHLVSITINGDSMAPTILDGETVVIDAQDRSVTVSGIYVIAPHGRYQLKRIHLRLDGSLKVMSDNPAYEPELLMSNQVDGLHVVGRMVWPRLRG
jgi:phage repressor protein C with HTH and peptisase S24 domain